MGVGVILSKALNKIGIESKVLSTAPHPFGFKEDYLLPRQWFIRYALGRMLWRKYYIFDLLHNHDNIPLSKYVLDHWKGRMIQQYHSPATKKPLYPDVFSFVSLPTIINTVPNSSWLPLPVETDFFSPIKMDYDGPTRVGFCDQTMDPNKSQYIPKSEIQKALVNLKDKAIARHLRDIIHHSKMPEYFNNIDIWVDRFGLGFYGFAACEAASMGRPVICEIDEQARSYVPDCPFLVTTRSGISNAIQTLVEDEVLRKSLGAKAREYTLQIHDYMRVAKTCLSKYEEILESCI